MCITAQERDEQNKTRHLKVALVAAASRLTACGSVDLILIGCA